LRVVIPEVDRSPQRVLETDNVGISMVEPSALNMLTGDSPSFIEVKLNLSFDTAKSTARLRLLSNSLKESDLILRFPRLTGSVAEGITGITGMAAITII
jgi:hypothetical protein